MPHVVAGINEQGQPVPTDLVRLAHAQGLLVHPYTFRTDALPEYARGFDEVLRIFLMETAVDGVFTDFPDLVVRFLQRQVPSR
jgi:glycerophosphoryl diester phosphodiesterase